MRHSGWNVLDSERAILWRSYEFANGGRANTLVFRGSEGLVVVSPATKLEDRDYQALREFGEVTALVANNTFHHLGQRPWREKFPDAIGFAPDIALSVLPKKTKGLDFRPLSELALPDTIQIDQAPGLSIGESLVSIRRPEGTVWFTGDLLVNFPKLPPPPVGWVFGLSGSGPGFKLFKLVTLLAATDRRALREWAVSHLDSMPPALAVPGHGVPFESSDIQEQTRAQLRRI